MDSALRVQVMAFKNNQKFSSIVFLGAMATGNWITWPASLIYLLAVVYLFIIISENLTWK